MQPFIIESEKITLPLEVITKLKGKKVQFIEFYDGFVIKPVSDSRNKIRKFSKLSNLKQRKLIKGNPDELDTIKVWNEPNNL
ncbi:MAG: hypothetical protein GY749_35100 [Desulfobacteraceae bacterium]|nr:hypothetical protein [Desulfobacteraceae bacterium]